MGLEAPRLSSWTQRIVMSRMKNQASKFGTKLSLVSQSNVGEYCVGGGGAGGRKKKKEKGERERLGIR